MSENKSNNLDLSDFVSKKLQKTERIQIICTQKESMG
jgi:hypothetical protein